jgi:hypothetical protein
MGVEMTVKVICLPVAALEGPADGKDGDLQPNNRLEKRVA